MSWTLEPGSWIFFTIVSWYWEYYELDIRAWELDYFTIVSWYWEYYELDIRAWELDIRAWELYFFLLL